jgi:CRP-like cAMP-binding protein
MSDLMLMPILLKHLRLATVWDIVNLKVDEAVLNNCPLFRGMSPYQVKKIILLSDMMEFAPGDALIRQGENSTGMFVLLAGTVDVIIERDGTEMTVDRGKPGDLFGEIGFAARDVARTASIIASSRVSAIRLDAERAQRGMRFYPGIAIRLFRNISRVLGARLVASHERLLRTPDLL